MRACGPKYQPCCTPLLSAAAITSRPLSLTALNMGCMMRISNVGVSIMADHAKQVSLTNKPQTCVPAAATDATQLLELHLCGCGFVTDFDVADICKVCASGVRLQAQRLALSTAAL